MLELLADGALCITSPFPGGRPRCELPSVKFTDLNQTEHAEDDDEKDR
jgi:hypothetical protein